MEERNTETENNYNNNNDPDINPKLSAPNIYFFGTLFSSIYINI